MTFIATIKGGDASAALLVTEVLNSILSPVFTTVESTSMEICRLLSSACCSWKASAGEAARESMKPTITDRPTTRLKRDQTLLDRPASRRRPGPAYRNSSPRTRAANTTDDMSQVQYSLTGR